MINVSSNQRVMEWKKGIQEIVRENMSVVDDAKVFDLTIHRDERDDYLMYLGVQADVEHLGLEFKQEYSCELRVTYGVCNRCSRQSGNYFEAIIQFRGGKRSLTTEELEYAVVHVQEKIEHSTAENAFISHIDEIHKGLDFYIGDKSIGKELARDLQHHFGSHYQESHSLAGRKDGKDIYRSTYLVRLLDLRKGDFVRHKEIDSIHLLEKITEKSATIMDLSTEIRRNIAEKEIEKLRRVHGDTVEAVVVSTGDGEAQVLDPMSFKTVTVLTPRPLKSGETIRFFRCEDGLFQIPE